jgi:hypothetical protein
MEIAIQNIFDEFKSTDTCMRLAAYRRIKQFANFLGPERARTELIPFLQGFYFSVILITVHFR